MANKDAAIALRKGVKGRLFRTQKGELTLLAEEVTLLTKVLLPLPDKWAGLADKGTRYRKRWLDLIVDRESMERLTMRSRLISETRSFFTSREFFN